MKTFPIALAEHYASGAYTLAVALYIRRADGTEYGFTTHNESKVIGGVTYDSAQGLQASDIASTAGFSVDNLELTTLDDGTLFTSADIVGGRWKSAEFLVFRYDWTRETPDIDPLLAGIFGELTQRDSMVRIELRGLQQYFQQPIGNVSTKTCRARLADYPRPNGKNLCRLSVVGSPTLLTTGTVTSASSRKAFVASAIFRGSISDYYGNGIITWLTGANAGLRQRVKEQTPTGNFSLLLPMPANIQVGDTFEAMPGCRGRRLEDCSTKWGNVLNFQGEPDIPGMDALTRTPEREA